MARQVNVVERTDIHPKVRLVAKPSSGLTGTVSIPGDKSISHRAILLGAMAVGETRVTGLLEAEDVLSTIAATRLLGASVERSKGGEWRVWGVGTGGFHEPDNVIDCGNSGTGARLLIGAVSTVPIVATFTGDRSLRSRPMQRVIDPMQRFGARIQARDGGRLPLTVRGASNAVPLVYELPVPSAQVKTAVMLAGLSAPGETCVVEPVATRDHTERMLGAFGASIRIEELAQGKAIFVEGHAELVGQRVAVPGDPSSAAFLAAAAAITSDSDVVLPGIGINPTRAGIFATLREMGTRIECLNERLEGGERVADLRVRGSCLKGVEVPSERAPSMIDEYPVLSVVASVAEGTTVMRGASELRVKESDRITAMVEGLRTCGVEVTEYSDGLAVHGKGPGSVHGDAICASYLDHRIAMSFLCLGLAANNPVGVDDASPIATSFPEFVDKVTEVGAAITSAP
ncbi:MAG: 3-phosphoshikimate 1-carboxyvinyltransferase [Rhodobacteraceae bacterium]|nr:3-phosphoshikimate 1-carboxyvinyltransferase [Paracoccaceae bacterium]